MLTCFESVWCGDYKNLEIYHWKNSWFVLTLHKNAQTIISIDLLVITSCFISCKMFLVKYLPPRSVIGNNFTVSNKPCMTCLGTPGPTAVTFWHCHLSYITNIQTMFLSDLLYNEHCTLYIFVRKTKWHRFKFQLCWVQPVSQAY